MGIRSLLYDNDIFSILFGTTIGNSLKAFVESIIKLIIGPLEVYLPQINVLENAIEFSLILLLVYALYKYMIIPIFKKNIKDDEAKEQLKIDWRKDVLNELRDINKNMKNGHVHHHDIVSAAGLH